MKSKLFSLKPKSLPTTVSSKKPKPIIEVQTRELPIEEMTEEDQELFNQLIILPRNQLISTYQNALNEYNLCIQELAGVVSSKMV